MTTSGVTGLVPIFANDIQQKLKFGENSIMTKLWFKDLGVVAILMSENLVNRINPN